MNRRLTRSRTDTVLGGVAAGLATYLNTDPALVRIAWAILVPLTGGAALLAYIVGWVVIPEGPVTSAEGDVAYVAGDPDSVDADATRPEQPAVVAAGPNDGRAGIVVGIGLVLLGVWFLAREYLPAFDWGLVWPLILVGIGVLVLVNAARRQS
jgi:phage shock protein C